MNYIHTEFKNSKIARETTSVRKNWPMFFITMFLLFYVTIMAAVSI